MTIKALVIDLDGTLYEPHKERLADMANFYRAKVYLKKIGVVEKMTSEELEDLKEKMSTGAVVTAVREVGSKYNLKMLPFENYLYDVQPKDFGIRKDPKLVSQLSKLSRYYTLAILSNGYGIWASRALKVLGVDGLISRENILTLSTMNGYMKPQPEAFEMLLNKLNMKESEIIFIDDREKNLEGARKLGIKSIKVDNDNVKGKDSIYSVLDRIINEKKDSK